MKDDKDLKKIQEAIDSLPEDFSILEEQIDVDLQMAYFEMVKELRNNEFDDSFVEDAKKSLYRDDLSVDDIKQLLVQLAGFDDIQAFRIIEAFHKQSKGEIKNWAVLALQESRMVIQSSLLGEQQVFISTGLGGKGQNIRYFVAMTHDEFGQEFNDTQKKLVESELCFFLEKAEGELEGINFNGSFALCLFLFPLKQNLHETFKLFIDECNQYGNFLNEDVIITNVKKLTVEELNEFITKNKNEGEQD